MARPSWIARNEESSRLQMSGAAAHRCSLMSVAATSTHRHFQVARAGPVMLRRLNLDGDRQADLEVHGGTQQGRLRLPLGALRILAQGIAGAWNCHGAILAKISPPKGSLKRTPASETDFASAKRSSWSPSRVSPATSSESASAATDIMKRFLASGRSGIYFSVLEEGLVNTGDTIERVHEDERRLSIADINRAYVNHARQHSDCCAGSSSLEILPSGLHD